MSVATAAQRSQRAQALAKANRIRMAKAALRKHLKTMSHKDARVELARLITHGDERVVSCTLSQALRSVPRWDKGIVRPFCDYMGSSADDYIGDLSDYEVFRLLEALDDIRIVRPHAKT